jgi:type 1 fimbria pilin
MRSILGIFHKELEMRKTLAVLAAAAFLASSSVAIAAEMTVTGEVVDIACHMKKGAGGVGEAHKGCATGCAKKGAAMGIMADDGVYEITGDYAASNNAKLLEFVAAKVEAKGDVTEKDGKKVINVTSMQVAK